LADDGNFRSFVFRFVAGRSGGSDGQESGDDELEKKSEIQLSKHMEMLGGKRDENATLFWMREIQQQPEQVYF
jgi:hypothetical protein